MAQPSVAKPSAGVLPIPASATQKPATPAKSTPKPPAPRLKLVVRRLPPGLTQTEFENCLGEEWKVGSGKVDWFQYKNGKVSRDPAKPSRPARAYLHLTSEDLIAPLSDKVKSTSFHDSRNTVNDPVLLGPPSLEFAPYARIPSGRVRKDGRQGTIDQDPEFIAFLESLTNPVPKPTPVDALPESEKKEEEVTTTPLVQFIKEKKANKAKESASPSKSKHKEKENKAEKVQAKKLLKRAEKETPQQPTTTDKKTKVEKATKEAVKAANKQAANAAAKASKAAPAPAPKETAEQPSTTTPTPAPERKRERGDISAAAKILQRDLGLVPSGGRRRGGKSAQTTEECNAKTAPSQPPTPTPTTEPAPSRATPESAAPPTGPAATTSKASKQSKAKQTVSPTATQAFLKHANPSQGVTEPLLETTFSAFGKVLKVEIDKKKGFGYVDFAEPEGLQKAIAASPVTVAQSQVVVLERKNPPQPKGKGGNEPQQQQQQPQQQQQQQQAQAQQSSQRSGKSGKWTRQRRSWAR
ncbi:hypothetical protein T310_3073 [Rasamsonia emersonii CBS 393.64]|uniref:RRM domain-containing protein n=1 Tax=Rasamsonia emersonii (strain ATCC 16479 / CBS 393.64 / IMI 116815) TaxID=1408163 RepID=A0A0F4YX70_RASE3|nr:hypothetical protein T310_3073 [Rasamsonia emersonii CBS 393.64]KKA22907.1 hypothetical protein T310_3073 [Rasamsonia emersonii CBS 393.64]